MLRIEERHFVDPRGTTEDQRTKILGEHLKLKIIGEQFLENFFMSRIEDGQFRVLRRSTQYRRNKILVNITILGKHNESRRTNLGNYNDLKDLLEIRS